MLILKDLSIQLLHCCYSARQTIIIFNLNSKQIMTNNPEYIYIRELSGIAFQVPYHKNKPIRQILQQQFKTSLPNDLRILTKGRLLEIEQSLQSNNIRPNQILHLLNISRECEDQGYVYLSFQDKIHRINFNNNESVEQFKQKVQRQTQIQAENQIILYSSIQLENFKKLRDYQFKNGDFLCMGKISKVKSHVIDIPQIIYPNKNDLQKRKRSFSIQNYKKNDYNFNNIDMCMPSPLSQQEQSFKNVMQDWIKDHPKTISQNFYQQQNLGSSNYFYQNSEQFKLIESNKIQRKQQNQAENNLIQNSCSLNTQYRNSINQNKSLSFSQRVKTFNLHPNSNIFQKKYPPNY